MNGKAENKHLLELKRNGFTIINNAIPANECDRISRLADKLYKKYSKKQNNINPLEETVYNLHNKDPIFLKYINYNKTINIVRKALSEGSYTKNSSGKRTKNAEIILRQTAIRNPLKGYAQQLHNDTRLTGCKHPLVIHIMYMISDFDQNNGATRVVPKSHLLDFYAKNKKKYKNERIVVGKKGTAVIFDASIWHGSSVKKNNLKRWGMIISYSRWFLKPDFDYNKNTPMFVYKKLNYAEKTLMGYRVNPPKDEFICERAIRLKPEKPYNYKLPI